jgi:SAM-dependent methyltransferase
MGDSISRVAFPLLFVGGLVLVTLWLLEFLPWKPGKRISGCLDRWGALEFSQLGSSRYALLFLISAAGLFLELLLIRWVSSEIRIFAYFKNLVLIGCFFGFGVGCYWSRRRIQMFQVMLPLVVLSAVTSLPWPALRQFLLNLSTYIGELSDVHVWGRQHTAGVKLYVGIALAFSVVIFLLALATIAMIPMGQMVARYLETASAGITAYSVNVAASVVGIWAFTGLCFVSAPPVVWFSALGVALLALFWRLPGVRISVVVSFVVMAVLFLSASRVVQYDASKIGGPGAVQTLSIEEERTYWSPYQKLMLDAFTNGTERVRYVLNTNGSWYQDIMNLSPDFVARYPQYTEPVAGFGLPFHRYNLPYRFVAPPENVLILGSGMGNDIAAALRNGARRVVAVEIDPLIVQLGREYHPEHPYSDPRVVAVVNDARNYVQNTSERFDLIVSSILDSHTTQSSFTNIRTDNYVYTKEGLDYMTHLLKPGGVLSLSFSGERRWFAGRLRELLTQVTNRPPLMLRNGYMFFLVGDNIPALLEKDAQLHAFVEPRTKEIVEEAAITTDDWPYFYNHERGVPVIVILLSGLVLLACVWSMRVGGLSFRNLQWHFFFLGAGFMLMEVQIISRLAVVYGTTWLVNSIVISALLLLILLANLTVARFPVFSERIAYAGLLVTLAVCYFVPLKTLLFEVWWQRAVMSTLLLCSPVFFAGLIFISSFARSKFQAEAFGSNLLGSVVGGLLEALSFWTGLRSLLIVAGICYLISLATRRGMSAETASSVVSEAAG